MSDDRPGPSIFSDEWRAQQEAHYQYVIRTGNAKRRNDIKQVMRDLGYDEQEIAQLYMQATMHVDDMPDDFVPDLETLEALRDEPHSNECRCPSCSDPGDLNGL